MTKLQMWPYSSGWCWWLMSRLSKYLYKHAWEQDASVSFCHRFVFACVQTEHGESSLWWSSYYCKQSLRRFSFCLFMVVYVYVFICEHFLLTSINLSFYNVTGRITKDASKYFQLGLQLGCVKGQGMVKGFYHSLPAPCCCRNNHVFSEGCCFHHMLIKYYLFFQSTTLTAIWQHQTAVLIKKIKGNVWLWPVICLDWGNCLLTSVNDFKLSN